MRVAINMINIVQIWLSLPKYCSDIINFIQEFAMLNIYGLKYPSVANNRYVQSETKHLYNENLDFESTPLNENYTTS